MSEPGKYGYDIDEVDEAHLDQLFALSDEAVEDCDYAKVEELNKEIREILGL